MNNTVWLSPVYFNPQIVQGLSFLCEQSENFERFRVNEIFSRLHNFPMPWCER